MVGPNQPGSPFIELPDGVRDEEDGSVFTFCWLDHTRGCSGGCEAFDNANAGDETGTWSSCRFVNLAHILVHSVVTTLRKQTPAKVPGSDIPPPGSGV